MAVISWEGPWTFVEPAEPLIRSLELPLTVTRNHTRIIRHAHLGIYMYMLHIYTWAYIYIYTFLHMCTETHMISHSFHGCNLPHKYTHHKRGPHNMFDVYHMSLWFNFLVMWKDLHNKQLNIYSDEGIELQLWCQLMHGAFQYIGISLRHNTQHSPAHQLKYLCTHVNWHVWPDRIVTEVRRKTRSKPHTTLCHQTVSALNARNSNTSSIARTSTASIHICTNLCIYILYTYIYISYTCVEHTYMCI